MPSPLLPTHCFCQRIRRLAFVIWTAIFLAVCGASAQSNPAHASQQAEPGPRHRGREYGPRRQARGQLFLYANGAWIARTEIPPDRAGMNVFSVLDDISRKQAAAIVEEAAKSNAPAGSDTRKIADLYDSFMDESAIEAKGLSPLKPHLAEIAAIQDRHQLSLALGKTLRADVDMLNTAVFTTPNLFGLWVAPGFSDSDHYMPYLEQGGSGTAQP